MPKVKRFSTPANVRDFPDDPAKQAALDRQWNTNLCGFTQQSIVANPWQSTNQTNFTGYYNPLTTDIPHATAAAMISWPAFPHRPQQYFMEGQLPPNPYSYTMEQILELADSGYLAATGLSFPQIPQTPYPLDWTSSDWQRFGPYGPRGWCDEYCEWNVVRNADGKITRVDFTCENPEYYNTLWLIDPARVAHVYQETLNHGLPAQQQITVSVADLQLYDPVSGDPVIDPSTGRPAYNPLNKWNCGTIGTRTGTSSDAGGAMHLTSTPNTLQTEIGIAGLASAPRTTSNASPEPLNVCGGYGRAFRNSDPHIGQVVNVIVGTGARVALADPTGLYLQAPDLSGCAFASAAAKKKRPAGAQAADCWTVVRGVVTMADPVTGADFPGNMILHGAFQIPKSWLDLDPSWTLEDITILDSTGIAQPIRWGGQIVQTLEIGLFARPIPGLVQPPQECIGTPEGAAFLPQPFQLMHAAVWNAYQGTNVPNAMNEPMTVASNSTLIAPIVEQGATGVTLALTCALVGTDQPTVSFTAYGITVTKVQALPTANYAVPGNSYPGDVQVLLVTIDVAADAELGLCGLRLTPTGHSGGPPPAVPAFLNITPAGTRSGQAKN